MPKKPIKFWMEKTIPFAYRKPIRDGIEEWNKAFEKAGFYNAIEVEQQPDSAEWDPGDINYNTFRWITSGAGFAMGPSRVNPTTGEILDADIIFDADFLQYWKQEYEYFTPEGKSVRKALLRTPIDRARISSHFGMRKHPIYGFSRMHTGVDFAAPRGTPVFAAGDGKIEYMGRNGGYGNYVRIRHNGSFQTAYGHMKGFARHLGAGHRVEQGDVIGYVGSTGVSTGPHLHYEIIQNGQKINPLELKLPSGIKLTGRELARFQAHREKVRRRFRALGEEIPSGDGLVAEVSATSSSVVPARATQ